MYNSGSWWLVVACRVVLSPFSFQCPLCRVAFRSVKDQIGIVALPHRDRVRQTWLCTVTGA